MITSEASNRLYAAGWRSEVSPLMGPRIVFDSEHGVYATITADDDGTYHWAVWAWLDGSFLRGGRNPDPEAAASDARIWITDEWM